MNTQARQRHNLRVLQRLSAERSRLKRAVESIEIIRRLPPPSLTQLICVMVVFNESLRLPDSLRHYRSLGIERFAIMDNSSTDSTRDYLLQQPDVDLYSVPLDYKTSVGGCGWVSALIHIHYGAHRWVVWSDADEQLVFDGSEQHDLHALTDHMKAMGNASLPCVMVDMYSHGDLSSVILHADQTLLECCPYFDGNGYQRQEIEPDGLVPRVVWSGGASERVFGNQRGWMAKIPLIYWRPETWYWNPHVAYPFELNFNQPSGALLHFKYMADFAATVDREVSRNQHASNAEKYRVFQNHLRNSDTTSLHYGESARYENSTSLLERKLITAIHW
ncbi:glycosyltransferase family 2 protein [Stieleria varia]|uniref:Glycosyl transferase family 2 n=1 Tax=Stieleria varia TaxID=2528005 RepID=A0A5C6AZG4_9BACT|nr:glycosyltransferase family 2 protein [Stieleria varia]TWU04406.1 hypothetical protein Pla52n_24460 [Stieleria varia]